MFRKTVAAALAVLSLGAVGASTASADAGPGTCKYADSSALTTSGNKIANAIMCLTNKERITDPGLQPLTNNTRLSLAAVRHSQDMARRNYTNLTSPEGMTPKQRMAQVGYVAIADGETVASGLTTPRQVVAAWMSNPLQRTHITSYGVTEIGIGVWFMRGGEVKITADFGRTDGEAEGTVTGLEPQFQKKV